MKFSKALYICLAALSACLALCAQSTEWQWLGYSSGVGVELCNDIAVDAAGNTWLVGGSDGDCQFGSLSHTSDDLYGLVAKADADGNWLWLQWAGGPSSATSIDAVEVDAAGNGYITGSFMGDVTFGSTTLSSPGTYDVFTAKISATGNWLWAKRVGETANDHAYGLALDSDANVYVSGKSGDDAFIVIYTSTGIPVTGATYPSTGYASGQDIVIDASGNAIMTGYFTGSITFGATTLISAGYEDIFIVKITPMGAVDWAKRAGGGHFDRANSLCLDSAAMVYVTGHFNETASFGPINLTSAGESDIFIAKLTSAGNWGGAVRAGGTEADRGFRIAVESAYAIYVAGYFSGIAGFGSHTLSSVGYADMFVAKANLTGSWLWAKGAGSAYTDFATGLAIDPGGELRVGGSYDTEMTVGNQVLPDANAGYSGFWEVFLFKIGAVIPLMPQNLALTMSGGDAILSWSPVTQTVYGQLVNPGEYIIYRSDGTIDGPYTELGRYPGTSYTHTNAGDAGSRSFYRVSAYKY